MQKQQILKALNQAAGDDQRGSLALNFSIKDMATVPDWIMLLPAGPEVTGRDGRSWRLDQQTVLASFGAANLDLPIDIEHATELKAPEGQPAPAVGWVKELELREGAVWGRVEWNNEGGFMIADKQYRYISPVFLYDKQTMQIMRLTSAALTNQPNLALPALNREGTKQPQLEESKMLKKILAALGLAETVDEATALNAVGKLKTDLATALNRAEIPSLDKFVPRGDYDAVMARATNAEQKLVDQQKADQEKAINTEIDAALAAGKITPASKDFYVASCRAEGGLAAFKKFIAAAPVVAKPSGLDGQDPDKDKGLALNADQSKIATMFGNTAEDLKKYGAA